MGIAVVGGVVFGDLFGGAVSEVIKVEFTSSVVHDGTLVFSPAGIGEPLTFAFLIGEGLKVGHGGLACIEVGEIESAARDGFLKTFLVLEANLGFICG